MKIWRAACKFVGRIRRAYDPGDVKTFNPKERGHRLAYRLWDISCAFGRKYQIAVDDLRCIR